MTRIAKHHNRSLAIAVLALALALAFAPRAHAAFKETNSWSIDIPAGTAENITYDIAADSTSGSLFSGYTPVIVGNNPSTVGGVSKWHADGTAGTPAVFGGGFSSHSAYAGVAVNPTTHDVYALVDPRNTGEPAAKLAMEPKIVVFEQDGTVVTSFPVDISEPTESVNDGSGVVYSSQSPGIDVDAAGNVYVPDPGAGVVNKYDSTGALLDTAELPVAPVNGTGDLTILASGTGDLTEGEKTISNVSNVGSYSLFQSISGAGIPNGSTIKSIDTGAGTLTISAAVEAGGTATGVAIASGSKTISNVTNVGSFEDGQPIAGAGLSTGTEIRNVDVGSSTLTISRGATAAGTGVSLSSNTAPLGHPLDAAVDAAGNLYVADRSTDRENEVQFVDKEGNTGGSYRISFNGAHTGVDFTGDPSYAKGTGDVDIGKASGTRSLLGTVTGKIHDKSNLITNITGTTGTLTVGAPISSAGTTTDAIALGTTITACSPSCAAPTSITMSQPAGGAAFSGLVDTFVSGSKVLTGVTGIGSATGTGTLTSGSTTVSGVSTGTGAFEVGQSVTGTGIPTGATIAAVNGGSGTLTLSAAATASGSQALTAGPSLEVGMGIVGSSFAAPPGFQFSFTQERGFATTITAIDPAAGTVTLSDGVRSAGSSSLTGMVIENVNTTTGQFRVQQRVKATGGGAVLAEGVFAPSIVAINGSSLVVADVAPPPADKAGVSFEAGGKKIFDVHVTSGQFSTELPLFGAGLRNETGTLSFLSWDLQAGTLDLSVQTGANVIPFTQGGDDVAYHGDFKAGLSLGGATGEAALNAMPTVSNAKLFGAARPELKNARAGGEESVAFISGLGGRDVPQMTCASVPADPLTGGTGTCSVSTVTQGESTPGRVAKFNSAMNWVSDLVPRAGSYTADAVTVDRSTGDVYVAGGNGDWGNPEGVITGPDAPEFLVTRYSSGGAELDQIGEGFLTAMTFHAARNVALAPAFGLSYNETSKRLYAVGRPTDLTYASDGATVRVFGPSHTLTVTPGGNGTGTIDAGSGAISGCSKSGGVCSDEYVEDEQVTLTATPGAHSQVDWTGVGCDTVTGNECTYTVGVANATISPAFTLIKRTVTLTVSGTGTGTISGDSGAISSCSKSGGVCSGQYDEGSTLTLAASPGSDSAVSSWTGCTSSSGNQCTLEIPEGNSNVSAVINLEFALTIHKTGNGNGTVECKVDTGSFGPCPSTVESGKQVTVHVAPDANSTFGGFNGSGGSASGCTGTSDCVFTIAQHTQVEVPLTLIPRNLTVNQTGNGGGAVTCDSGSGPGPCAATYNSGTSLTVAVTPNANSSFGGFSGSTGSAGTCGATSPCTFTITADTTVNAPLTLIPRNLTVNQTGNGGGTITCDSGSGPGPCAATYNSGTSLTVAVTPNSHSSFGGFSGSTGSAGTCGATSPCTFTITADTTVNVPLTSIPRNLSVGKTGTGSGAVTCNGGACNPSYPDGTTLTLTAAPGSHSALAGWTVIGSASVTTPCTGTTSPCEIKLEGGNVSVNAAYDLIHRQLKVKAQGTGQGTVDAEFGSIAGCSKSGGVCTENPIEGTPVILVATPDKHSDLDWTGCDSEPSASECEVVVTADTVVTATFTQRSHVLSVAKTGSGSGSVSCDGLACAASYPEGAKVTLAAAGDSSSSFVGWSGGGCSGTATCTVAVDADTTVSARFDLNPVVTTPSCATDPSLCQAPPLKCKKGFKKKRVKGKLKCVKVRKHKHRKHH